MQQLNASSTTTLAAAEQLAESARQLEEVLMGEGMLAVVEAAVVGPYALPPEGVTHGAVAAIHSPNTLHDQIKMVQNVKPVPSSATLVVPPTVPPLPSIPTTTTTTKSSPTTTIAALSHHTLHTLWTHRLAFPIIHKRSGGILYDKLIKALFGTLAHQLGAVDAALTSVELEEGATSAGTSTSGSSEGKTSDSSAAAPPLPPAPAATASTSTVDTTLNATLTTMVKPPKVTDTKKQKQHQRAADIHQSALRSAKVCANCVEYLLLNVSNASLVSLTPPEHFIDGEVIKKLIGAIRTLQCGLAAAAILPPAPNKSATHSKLSPTQLAQSRGVLQGLLTSLWQIVAMGAVADPEAAIDLITDGTTATTSTTEEEADKADGVSPAPTPNVTEAQAPKEDVPLPPLPPIPTVTAHTLAAYNAHLRVAYIAAGTTLARMLLAEPRPQDGLVLAVDVIDRVVLGLGPLRVWKGNQHTSTYSWLAVVNHLTHPTARDGMAALVLEHPDLASALKQLLMIRLTDSSTHKASPTDVVLLSLVDKEGYIGVVEELAGSNDLLTTSFGKHLAEADDASLLGPYKKPWHLKLLLAAGFTAVVCAGPTEAKPNSVPQVSADAANLRRKVRHFTCTSVGATEPCHPTSPALTTFLADVVLEGYLQSSALSRSAECVQTIANTMPNASIIATSIVNYGPFAMALRTNTNRVGTRAASTLRDVGAALWGCGSDPATFAPNTSSKKAASSSAAVRGILEALSRIGDVTARVGVLMMEDVIGGGAYDPVDDEHSQQQGEARGSDGAVVPTAAAAATGATTVCTVTTVLDAISYLAALPTRMQAKVRVALLEPLMKDAANALMAMGPTGGGDSTNTTTHEDRTSPLLQHVRDQRPLFQWLYKSVDAVTQHSTFPSYPPPTTSNKKGEAAAPILLPSVAIHAQRLIAPLVILASRPIVTAAANATLLDLWVPTAARTLALQDALTNVSKSDEHASSFLLSEYLLSLAHDALVAPIKFMTPIAALVMPTYVSIFVPRPDGAEDAWKGEAASPPPNTHSHPRRYPSMSPQMIAYWAAFVRPTMQSLEKCYAEPMQRIIDGDADLGNYLAAEQQRLGLAPLVVDDTTPHDTTPRAVASAPHDDGATALIDGAIGDFTVLKAELLLVQSLYENIAALYTQRAARQREMAKSRSNNNKKAATTPNNLNDPRQGPYMNSLAFLLLVQDPLVLARVCASLELILLQQLKGSQWEQDFWMKRMEAVITGSPSEATKTGLVTWWMRLGDSLRAQAMLPKL